MTDHTHLNLKDVDNSAEKFGLSPDLEARFARVALGLERSGVSYQRLAPGFRMPFGHRHREQEEVYVILSGSGRMKLEDEFVELGPLDAVRVPPAVTRGVEAGPDGLELIAFGAPGSADGAAQDTEQLPGWWSD